MLRPSGNLTTGIQTNTRRCSLKAMSLEPYQYRPATPPFSGNVRLDSYHSCNTSGSSVWSQDSSPNSAVTHITTPSHSPIRHAGPTLLPKIRTQDQTIEPNLSRIAVNHRRALSVTHNPPERAAPSRPAFQRATTTPPECVPIISPVSAASTVDSWVNSALNSPITLSSHQRRPGHSRSSSGSGIDDAALRRYGYPTYRNLPQYISRPAPYNPSVVPATSTFVPPPIIAPVQSQDLAQELRFITEDDPTSNLTEYLTGLNPAVSLVKELRMPIIGRAPQTHAWWDIRNLRIWEGFNLETIKSIPGFERFLTIDIRTSALPAPHIHPSPLQPQTEADLLTVHRDFYATKVNNALKICQGQFNHISMRTERSKDGPDFIANYQNDHENTLAGNGRGRVVGLVKSFNRWNTGMRRDAGQPKILYLTALAQLHRYMREHSCRYGFIMTEIELVCVRAGTEETPYFGLLELAPTIELKTQSGLTACLALWYLHMLANNIPLPGQCGWKMDVGPPGAMTRTKILPEKDAWIPEPQSGEKRTAKLARGWVLPGDPWHKKREGMGRRR